jgi:hypothetical protein
LEAEAIPTSICTLPCFQAGSSEGKSSAPITNHPHPHPGFPGSPIIGGCTQWSKTAEVDFDGVIHLVHTGGTHGSSIRRWRASAPLRYRLVSCRPQEKRDTSATLEMPLRRSPSAPIGVDEMM